MAEVAPDPAPPRPRRRSRIAWALALLGLLLGLLLAGLGWLIGSESGNRVALAALDRFGGGFLQIENPRGCLCDRWQATRLRLRLPGFLLEAEGVDAQWHPAGLLRRHLAVDFLYVDALSIRTAPSADAGPGGPPRSLALPLDIDAADLRVGRLVVGALPAPADGVGDFIATQLLGDFKADAEALAVGRLRGTLSGLTLDASGRIGVRPPFTLTLDSRAQTRVAGRDARLALKADGSLDETRVGLLLEGDGLQGAADGLLRPFAPMPLRQLELTVSGLDPSLFHPAAPRAKLDAKASLQPQDGAAPGASSGPAARASPADWRLAGFVELSNARPEPFDRGGLPLESLRTELAGSSRRLQADKLQARMAGGELEGRADWQPRSGDALGRIDAVLRLRGVKLEELVAAARPLHLTGRVEAQAGAVEQRFSVALRGDPRARKLPPLTVVAEGSQRESHLRLTRLDAQWAQARLALKGELALTGDRAFLVEGALTRFDPRAFAAGAPVGDINLRGRVGGALSPSWRADLQLDLQPSTLAGTPLRGQIAMLADAQRLARLDADLDLLGNRLKAQGSLGQPDDRLRFELTADRLQALFPEVQGGLRAQGTVGGSFTQPWGTLEASANGLRGGEDWNLASASMVASLEPGTSGRFNVEADTGRVVAGGRLLSPRGLLRIEGTRDKHAVRLGAGLFEQQEVDLTMQGGFADGRWLGRLESLVGQGPARFRLAEPVALELGAQRVELGSARVQSENGLIELQQTVWTPQEIVARGRMRGVQVGLSVDEFQRTVMRGRSLTLGGDWDVRIGQSANGLVRIYREGGDLVLQGDTPLALGLENLDINAAAQDGRLAFSANISGARIGVVTAVLAGAAERVGKSVRLVPDSPLVGTATVDVPSIAWLGPVLDQNLRIGGSLRGELNLGGTPGNPLGQGRLVGQDLEVALADQGLRLSDGKLRVRTNAGRLELEQLEFASRRALDPPDPRALPPDAGRLGRLAGSGHFELGTGEGELRLEADRVAVLQTPRQWLLVSGPATLAIKKDQVKLDAQLVGDGAYFGVQRRTAPTLSEDVVVRGQQTKPADRLRIDAKVRFDLGERFYLKAYGIDARLAGRLDLTQEDGRWRLRGAIDAADGVYAAYGQRLTIERGTVSFYGPLDNPALNVVALRKGLAVEAGVEVSGTARAPRVRLVSEPVVPEAEKLSWLLLGRASEASGQDTGLLLTAASAALGDEGEGVLDRIIDGVGLDQVSVGQGSSDVMRQRTSRVASTATGTPSSAAGTTASQEQVLTLGKRLNARTYLSLEQNLSGTESVVKLSLALNRFLSLIARAGTENALDLQYSISFR